MNRQITTYKLFSTISLLILLLFLISFDVYAQSGEKTTSGFIPALGPNQICISSLPESLDLYIFPNKSYVDIGRLPPIEWSDYLIGKTPMVVDVKSENEIAVIRVEQEMLFNLLGTEPPKDYRFIDPEIEGATTTYIYDKSKSAYKKCHDLIYSLDIKRNQLLIALIQPDKISLDKIDALYPKNIVFGKDDLEVRTMFNIVEDEKNLSFNDGYIERAIRLLRRGGKIAFKTDGQVFVMEYTYDGGLQYAVFSIKN